jgi:chemotaxis signal transduction protein
MGSAQAWVLDFGTGTSAAVGALEMVHVLTEQPRVFEIPRSPSHVRCVCLWQDRVVPLLDVRQRVDGAPTPSAKGHAAIVRYRPRPGEPLELGALRLAAVPRSVLVSDEQACDLPPETGAWRGVALSCFAHDDRPVPILDLARLFSPAPEPD